MSRANRMGRIWPTRRNRSRACMRPASPAPPYQLKVCAPAPEGPRVQFPRKRGSGLDKRATNSIHDACAPAPIIRRAASLYNRRSYRVSPGGASATAKSRVGAKKNHFRQWFTRNVDQTSWCCCSGFRPAARHPTRHGQSCFKLRVSRNQWHPLRTLAQGILSAWDIGSEEQPAQKACFRRAY